MTPCNTASQGVAGRGGKRVYLGCVLRDGRGGVGTAYEGGYGRRDAHNQGAGS